MELNLRVQQQEKLLKKPDALMDPQVLGDIDPIKVVKYVSVFKAMNKVVEACFGTGEVTVDVQPLVDDLI